MPLELQLLASCTAASLYMTQAAVIQAAMIALTQVSVIRVCMLCVGSCRLTAGLHYPKLPSLQI